MRIGISHINPLIMKPNKVGISPKNAYAYVRFGSPRILRGPRRLPGACGRWTCPSEQRFHAFRKEKGLGFRVRVFLDQKGPSTQIVGFWHCTQKHSEYWIWDLKSCNLGSRVSFNSYTWVLQAFSGTVLNRFSWLELRAGVKGGTLKGTLIDALQGILRVQKPNYQMLPKISTSITTITLWLGPLDAEGNDDKASASLFSCCFASFTAPCRLGCRTAPGLRQ